MRLSEDVSEQNVGQFHRFPLNGLISKLNLRHDIENHNKSNHPLHSTKFWEGIQVINRSLCTESSSKDFRLT